MAKGILGGLNNGRGIEWYHLLILIVIVAGATYYLTGGMNTAVPTDSEGYTPGVVGILCYDLNMQPKPCSEFKTMQAVVAVTSPASAVMSGSGLGGVSFKLRATNTGTMDISVAKPTTSCTCTGTGCTAAPCDTAVKALAPNAAQTAYWNPALPADKTKEWTTGVLPLQATMTAGTYTIPVSMTATATSGTPPQQSTQGATIILTNTPEVVQFIIDVPAPIQS